MAYRPYQSMTFDQASAVAAARLAFWRSLPSRKWPWGMGREYADAVKREGEIIRDAVLRSPIVWC
jgi:broad specificity phosphatase PhoE